MKQDLSNQTRAFLTSSKGNVIILNFRKQLRKIVQRNLNQIAAYSEFRLQNSDLDPNLQVAPIVLPYSRWDLEMNLVLSTDGVNIKKSTYKKELWLVWLQCSDLPPILRMSRKNIIPGCLFVGNSAPNWNESVTRLRAELISPIDFDHLNFPRAKVIFKVRLLVADMCAKAHVLNMIQFNGYFGCHFCTAEGKAIGKTHAYYPFRQSGDVREPELNNGYIRSAELLQSSGQVNVYGVKGRSAFSDLMDNLPLAAPVDYMHCVLLRVFPELLRQLLKKSAAMSKREINEVIQSLACPRELISYSRKIRSLEEIGTFQANEFFNWMFYISSIVFRNKIPTMLYENLLNLVFGIRLLLKSSREENILLSEKLLDSFCASVVDIFDGNERLETINVHSLRHLPEQVRRFGPMFSFSAMSFESANRILGEVYSGSHHECKIICRRFLQKQRLRDLHHNCDDSKIGSLVKQLLRHEDSDTYPNAMYPNATFLNRFSINGVYYDSPAYSLAPSSGLFNSFVCYLKDDTECFGPVWYFVSILDAPFFGNVHASVLEYKLLDEIGPVKGFFLYNQKNWTRGTDKRWLSIEVIRCSNFRIWMLRYEAL